MPTPTSPLHPKTTSRLGGKTFGASPFGLSVVAHAMSMLFSIGCGTANFGIGGGSVELPKGLSFAITKEDDVLSSTNQSVYTLRRDGNLFVYAVEVTAIFPTKNHAHFDRKPILVIATRAEKFGWLNERTTLPGGVVRAAVISSEPLRKSVIVQGVPVDGHEFTLMTFFSTSTDRRGGSRIEPIGTVRLNSGRVVYSDDLGAMVVHDMGGNSINGGPHDSIVDIGCQVLANGRIRLITRKTYVDIVESSVTWESWMMNGKKTAE